MNHVTATPETRPVMNEAAIKFLECACRNWRHLPHLTKADVEDVRVELERFRLAAVRDLEAQLAEARELLAEWHRWEEELTDPQARTSHPFLPRARAFLSRTGDGK